MVYESLWVAPPTTLYVKESMMKRKPGEGRVYIYEGREVALPHITNMEAHAARLTVAEYALDAKDAVELLETLGLEPKEE